MRPRGHFRRLRHDWRVGVVVVLVWGAVVGPALVRSIQIRESPDSTLVAIERVVRWGRTLPGPNAVDPFIDIDSGVGVAVREGRLCCVSKVHWLEGDMVRVSPTEVTWRLDLFPLMDPSVSETEFERLIASGPAVRTTKASGIFYESVAVRTDRVHVKCVDDSPVDPAVRAVLERGLGSGFSRGPEASERQAIYRRWGVNVLWGGLALDIAGVLSSLALPLVFGNIMRKTRRRGRECPGCGYDTRGVDGGVCPECGRADT